MNIIQSLVLTSCLSSSLKKDNKKVIVFVDDGISEILKYKKQEQQQQHNNNNDNINDDDIIIYSLEWPLSTLLSTSLLLYQPNHIVFIISTPLPSLIPIIDSIINISKCIEVVILTTSSIYEISEQLGKSDDDNIDYDINDPYNFLYSLFDHNNLKIKHLPLYSIPIVSTYNNNNSNIPLDIHILGNPICRKILPLTLHKLGLWNNNKSHGIQHINDIIGTDINSNKAYDLKTLAHQIAGVLVLELGLNTTDAIFTLGKTSSLLGYNLQSYLPTLMKSIQNDNDNDDYIGIKLLKSIGINSKIDGKNLKSASLILIDRTEDLFTPSSSSGNFPIAHRIISTIDRYYGNVLKVKLNDDNNNFDTNVEPYPLIDINTKSSYLQSMSLQSTLLPSLSLSDMNLNNSIILANESDGMKVIVSQLSDKKKSSSNIVDSCDISSCLSKIIPKTDNYNEKYNVKTLIDNYNIISTSLAIIEANNNNDNSKWKCSIEIKSLRELKIESLIKKGAGLDVIVPILLSYLTEKEEGPADIAHLILQIMRVVSILPESIVDSVEMTLLSKGISDYISNNCIEDELKYLSIIQILPNQLFNDIISYRKGDKTKQYIKADIQEIILTIVSNLIEISEIRKPPQEDRITDILGNLIDSNNSSSTSYSVLAMSIKALLDQRLYLINQSSLFRNDALMPRLVPCFEHIETPLQQLKRTGISLLSQGLGRFGFGSVANNIITSPHPSDNNTIVIMMIGGITFKEIYEVQKVISTYRQNDVANIIIISTNILSPDDLLCNIVS